MAVAKKTTSTKKTVKKIAAPLAEAEADLEPAAEPITKPPVPTKTAPSGAAAKKTRATAVAAKKTVSTGKKETPSKKTVRVANTVEEHVPTPEAVAKKTTAVKKKRLVTVRKAPHTIKPVAELMAEPVAVIIDGVLQPQTTINPNAPWPFRQDMRKK